MRSQFSCAFSETDESRGFVRGAKWGLMPLGAAMSLFSTAQATADAQLHRLVRERLGHSVIWGLIGEDLPEATNYVTLDATLTDSDGIPAPKIVYRNSENSHGMLAFHVDRRASRSKWRARRSRR